MYEKRLKELSNKLGGKEEKFCILTHKKHNRELYFQNNQKAIGFLASKFNTHLKKFGLLKKLAYFFIKRGILQPFLKKIKLSSNFGEVIFLGGQIKGFNLRNREVISFPKYPFQKKNFIKSKQSQNQLSKKRFAPKILWLNEEIPCSKEKLLKGYEGNKDSEIFRKLEEFYKLKGIKKVSLNNYVKSLKKMLEAKRIKSDSFKDVINELENLENKKLFLTTIHGDFAKENMLVDKKEGIVFIDWAPREGPIVEDLINFFRNEENLQKNKKFMRILREVFPREVQRDIKLYLELHEITSTIPK